MADDSVYPVGNSIIRRLLLTLLALLQHGTRTGFSAQVVSDVTSVKLLYAEPVAEEGERVTTPILDAIVLVARRGQQTKENHAGPGKDAEFPIQPALLEPASARTRPRRALEEEIGVLDEGVADLGPGRHGFDVLDLHLLRYCQDVLDDVLDERDEGAVAQRPVGSYAHPVVRNCSDSGQKP